LRYLVAAIAWGGVIAVALVLPVQVLVASRADLSDATMATVVAPLTEETAKGLFLLVILLRRRRELTGVTDGLVYAGLVGIGFAFTENVGYYANVYAGTLTDEVSGAGAATGLFIVRGLFSPFAHSLFACGFGLGMGVAVSTRRRWLMVVAPVLGLAFGIGLHALWNGSVIIGGPKSFLLVYAFMFVPIFLGFVGLAAWIRQREGRLLIRALTDAAWRRWIHPDEIPWLTRFGLRRAARRNAIRVAGKPTARALRHYQELATSMAFSHDRVLRGRAGPGGPIRVQQRLAEMAVVRPYIVLPPPLPMLMAGSWAGPPPGRSRVPPPTIPPAPPSPPYRR
ncbi:MAG: PrsW family intramembrane metalloprotease, partial [Actinomycetota bacterium]|nr:PrsW family intramembrane metalloprotease [Actinomycetota bacterium]